MPKYFLHQIINGTCIKDYEGGNFPSLKAAEIEAVAAAREIAIDSLRSGKGLLPVVFEIMDEAGQTAATVPFEKALAPG
jgi:hypothetical protein